jgi:hypothetical protein
MMFNSYAKANFVNKNQVLFVKINNVNALKIIKIVS